MKRILISLLIIFLVIPFTALAQETKTESNETEQPESFFNDLIKTLNPVDTTKKAPEKTEGLPLPKPIEIIEPQEVSEPVNNDEKTDTPVPATPNPNVDMETTTSNTTTPLPATVTPVPLPVNDDASNNAPAQVPANTPQIAPQPVASPDIVIGTKGSKKKEKIKKEKVEKEKRIYQPYIEAPDPKSKSQKKYVTDLEKKPNSRMRLITLDQADIVQSRKYRSAELALQNPANLGVRAEYASAFSIIPINTLELDVKTSTRPFVFIDEYLSSGELLTPEREDSMVAMLGPNGLELPIELNLPTVANIKMAALGGSFFVNAGLFVKENMTIPGEFFGIILDGATIDDPFVMDNNLGVDLNVYAKGSAGYGTFVELPLFLGELRFGATVNAYAGAFTDVNITNIEITPTSTGLTASATAQILSFADTLNILGPEGFQFGLPDDYFSIPGITLGYDFGIGWRFKLNRLLPIAPNFIKNYFDIQIGIQDLGASIEMNHAYLRELNFEMEVGDLLTSFGEEFSLDSAMVISETLVYADSTISKPLGAKFHMDFNYQPIPQLMLKGGFASYITDGINAGSGPNYYYGVEVYPISSLCLHGGVTQKNNYRYSEAGIKLYSQKSEFGLKLRIYDLDFSLTENLSGAGLQLSWARYF
jgi:hypothetical protein